MKSVRHIYMKSKGVWHLGTYKIKIKKFLLKALWLFIQIYKELPEQSPMKMLLDLILKLNIALNCLRISLVCSRGAYNAGTEPGSKPYEEGIGLMVGGINICLAFHRNVCWGTWSGVKHWFSWSGVKHWFMYHQCGLYYYRPWLTKISSPGHTGSSRG